MDKSSRSRNELQISTLNDELVLLVIRLADSATSHHIEGSNDLLTKEVSDLNGLAAVCHVGVDGEVSICQSELMDVSLLNTGEHVLDVADDRSDAGSWNGGTEPHFASNLSAEVD